MSTANRGRLLRALIEQIVVDEPNGKIDIQLARLDEDVTAEQGEAAE